MRMTVIPAKAGIHAEYPELLICATTLSSVWIPVFTGMTALSGQR